MSVEPGAGETAPQMSAEEARQRLDELREQHGGDVALTEIHSRGGADYHADRRDTPEAKLYEEVDMVETIIFKERDVPRSAPPPLGRTAFAGF